MKPLVATPCSVLGALALMLATGAGAAEADASAAPGVPPVLASELAAAPSAVSAPDPSIGPRTEDASSDPAPASPRWVPGAELTSSGYSMSLSRGALDLGLHFETPAGRLRPLQAGAEPVSPVVSPLPSLSFGLRQGRPATAGTLLERSTGGRPADNYVSKVGVEWKPAESRVNFLREGLGIRLEGNDRMTVRLRKGVIGVYMHRKF